MKKFKVKNKIKKIIISLFLMMSVLFVAACSYSDKPPTEEEGGKTFIADIDGFKINYRPDIFEVSDFYYHFSYDILSALSSAFGNANFGSANKQSVVVNGTETEVVPYIYQKYLQYLETLEEEDEAVSYKVFENSHLVYFIDDIRNSVYLSDETPEEADLENYIYNAESSMSANSWKWTHKIEEESTHGYDLLGSNYKNAGLIFGDVLGSSETASLALSAISSFARWEERNNYYSVFYAETYAKALQVAVLQILLDVDVTEFSFNFVTDQVMPNPDNLLGDGTSEGLKFEYKKHAEYIGVSETDIDSITNYLLDAVIGAEKYNSEGNHFKRDDYKVLIEELVWNTNLKEYYFSNEDESIKNDESLGSIYNIYPTTIIEDFPAYSFFVNSNDKKAFEHIPSGQFRSIVVMPTKTDYLYTMMFYMAASSKLNINLHYRYYDAETDTLFESDVFSAQTYIESDFSFYDSDMISLIFEDNMGKPALYKMTKFNQEIGNGILKAQEPKVMNYETSQYFEESKGGFGLNHLKFKEDGSSFLEIVFDTNKGGNLEGDFNFKVGMQAIYTRDPDEFYQ